MSSADIPADASPQYLASLVPLGVDSLPESLLVEVARHPNAGIETLWAVAMFSCWPARRVVAERPDCPNNLLQFIASEQPRGSEAEQVVELAYARLRVAAG